MKEHDIKYLLAQVVIAIRYLHEIRISHRDIKPKHIWVFSGMKIKIAGFFLSKFTENELGTMTQCGTAMFCAPEAEITVRESISLPFRTDIYSFGLTACWMMMKMVPLILEIYKKDIKFPDEYSQEL